MDKLFNYKGYRYFIGDTNYTIYNKHGITIKGGELNSEGVHKKIHDIIDEIEGKTPKTHITLYRVDDNTFDVYGEKDYLGWFKTAPNDMYKCFKSGEMYRCYVAKGLHNMMNYFRRIEKGEE